ncbi:hypothetical protein Daus18300_012122 [Diaporthe australafricana]|uniref:Uncharacterized protein n=1 Tax=Diaporthe australafricana TaxID=127596 RepID=A0ABR3W425_9PEZI
MNGGQHVPAPDQYSKGEIWSRGLACPFAKSDPQKYMNIGACKPTGGFTEISRLFEHMWRKHTRFYRCGYCSDSWSIAKSRTFVKKEKEKHWKVCKEKLRGALLEGSDEDGDELLNSEQQKRFEKIKSTKDIGAKLKALYEACGMLVPDTYYATAVFPLVQPLTTNESAPRTTAHHDRQSISHGGLLEGFAVPGSPSQTRRLPTSGNVLKVSAASKDQYQVSGADRAPDADSGYVSWDPLLGWVTASTPDFVGTDDFVSAHDHDEHGYIPDYVDDDSAFIDGGGPSMASEDFLMGLTDPGPGADEAASLRAIFPDFRSDVLE